MPGRARILVPDLGTRILVPRSWYQDLGTRILVPRSWYQDLGTKILVPRSWYQDLVPRSWHGQAWHGTEIFGTARILRARHGNIWHGTDPPDLGTARHGTSLMKKVLKPRSILSSSAGNKNAWPLFMPFQATLSMDPGTSRALPCPDLVDPCRAKYFRAVP